MRTRPSLDERVAEVTQRRLDALAAELGHAPLHGATRASADVGAAGSDDPTISPVDPVGPADPPHDEREPEPDPDAGRHAQRPLPPTRRAGGWLADRLPGGLGTLQLGGAQLGLVALFVAGGLVLAAWLLVRSSTGGAPGELAPPSPSGGAQVAGADSPSPAQAGGKELPPSNGVPGGAEQAGASPGGTAEGTGGTAGTEGAGGAAGSTAPAGQVVVDVEGKVRRPGIAVLPAGSRVVDALEAAGGSRPGAQLGSLNLARLLVDGEQLVVGSPATAGGQPGTVPGVPPATAAPGTTPGSGSTGAPTVLVNLNTADQAALETLPGVGPVTAVAILQWRTEHGSFTSVDELLEVSGIGDATLAEIAPFATV